MDVLHRGGREPAGRVALPVPGREELAVERGQVEARQLHQSDLPETRHHVETKNVAIQGERRRPKRRLDSGQTSLHEPPPGGRAGNAVLADPPPFEPPRPPLPGSPPRAAPPKPPHYDDRR